jgi:hypothetical protein
LLNLLRFAVKVNKPFWHWLWQQLRRMAPSLLVEVDVNPSLFIFWNQVRKVIVCN